MSEDNWIAKTIVPKSDQLNADDLTAGPITITVTDVRQGEADQPVCICSEGRQPYKPCKTMRRLLVGLWGDQASQWVGRRLTLFADPTVKWGGVAVGGIRISHVSGIDQPHTVMITETRGKRKAMTVHPLPDVEPPKLEQPSISDRVERAITAYRDCKTADQLMVLGNKSDQLRSECDDLSKLKLTTVFESAMNKFNGGEN